MTIFIDLPIWKKSENGRKSYSHMMSNVSLEDLHRFAAENGVKKHFFHNTRACPHYDITEEQIPQVKSAGAIQISSKEMVLIARKMR